MLWQLTLDKLRGMLRLKYAELEQYSHDEQARLNCIEDRLRRIEQAETWF